MIVETLALPILLLSFSGTPRINPIHLSSGARCVADVRTSTLTKFHVSWDQLKRPCSNPARDEAFNLFGSMRGFNEEEQAIYDRVLKKMSKKTGINIFKLT